MALDVDKLHRALRNYSQELDKHQRELSGDFKTVNDLFALLFTYYGGQNAEELKRGWQQTAEWFREYQSATIRLNEHLQERARHLISL
jgi:uncharacterized membrane-anchored protein YhcB (DUF1043 family)